MRLLSEDDTIQANYQDPAAQRLRAASAQFSVHLDGAPTTVVCRHVSH